MSFFLRIKGCVNCCKTTSVYIKNAYSRAESFSHWERFLKMTAPLSNLITPCFLNLTDLVSVLSVLAASDPLLYFGEKDGRKVI
jgi:hypothetical protein